MVLCIQNSDFSIRITSPYRSQPTFVAFAFKTATLGQELQVSMGPRPHQWFFAFKTATLAPELQVSMVPSSHLWFCAFTTATLWPELIVSMGPRPHLCFFLHSKRGLLQQNCKPLWVPALIWCFCIENSVFWIRNTSVYRSQPSYVVLCMQKAWLAPELLVSMSPRPHLSFCECKTAWLAPESLVSMGLIPHLWFCTIKTATLASELLVSMGPSPHLWFLHAKQRL